MTPITAMLALLQGSDSERTLRFLNMPAAWVIGLVIVPAILLLSFAIYRREGESASPRVRYFLAAVRSIALLFLLFVYLRPVCVTTQFDKIKPVAAVLVDDSASMTRVEDYGDGDVASKLARVAGLKDESEVKELSRRELVQKSLAASDFATKLAQTFDVRMYAFDSESRLIKDANDLRSEGQSTQIGEALRKALNEFRAQDGWSIVLMSDGRNNMGADPAEAAKEAGLEGVPIHAVGVGNPAEPKNVAIRSLNAPDVALEKDDVAFEVVINSIGYEGEPASIVLFDNQQGSEVARKEFVLLGKGQDQRDTLYFRPDKEGEYVIRVEVPRKPGELNVDDNVRLHTLRVEPEKIKVLYVEGYPRWEYRFLKNNLLRADNMQVQCLLLSANPDFIQESSRGLPALTAFPKTKKDLFEYDVVILGDVDPYALGGSSTEDSERILKELKEFVELGGGFLMIAGELDSPAAYVGTPIEDLLPVEIGDHTEEEQNRGDRTPFRPRLENPQSPHEVVRLEKDAVKNRMLWEDQDYGLPPLNWYYPVRRPKPGAEVLLRHPTNKNRFGPHVLAATSYYPSGRTMFVAFDSTWLWRNPYGDRYTERFWRASIRYLALSKLRRLDKRVEVTTDKSTYEINERIVVRARIRDADFNPSTAEEATVKFQTPSGEEQSLVLKKTEDGIYERSMHAAIAGRYRLWAEDESGQSQAKLSLTTFSVEIPRREMENPILDRSTLQAVASASHGTYRGLHELDDLIADMKGEIVKRETGEDQEDLWDNYRWLLVFVALMSTEWAVRKKFHLL